MKRFFAYIIAALAVLMPQYAAAQGRSLVATLSHQDQVTAFYGVDALKDAHEQAEDGDIITLSPGTFSACDIKKSITVRGAGYVQTPEIEPTIILGDLSVYGSKPNSIVLESFYLFGKLTNRDISNQIIASVNKCLIKEISFMGGDNYVSFNACIITDSTYNNSSTFDFKNCIISNFTAGGSYEQYILNHCVVHHSSTHYCTIVQNSIFFATSTNSFQDSLFENNLIFTGESASHFPGDHNFFLNPNDENYAQIFTDYDWDNVMEATWQLTELAKTEYPAADGTEMGIYGGDFPFSKTPDNPQITRFEVPTRSDASGHLNVKVQVSIPE